MFTRWKGPKSTTEHATHVLVAYRASLSSIRAHQVLYRFMSQVILFVLSCFTLSTYDRRVILFVLIEVQRIIC